MSNIPDSLLQLPKDELIKALLSAEKHARNLEDTMRTLIEAWDSGVEFNDPRILRPYIRKFRDVIGHA